MLFQELLRLASTPRQSSTSASIASSLCPTRTSCTRTSTSFTSTATKHLNHSSATFVQSILSRFVNRKVWMKLTRIFWMTPYFSWPQFDSSHSVSRPFILAHPYEYCKQKQFIHDLKKPRTQDDNRCFKIWFTSQNSFEKLCIVKSQLLNHHYYIYKFA